MISYIGAVDQGTTSTRFSIFDKTGRIMAWDKKEHRQIFTKPGWVEHDPEEIWRNTQDVIKGALAKGGIGGEDITAIGITNQRETTVVWDKRTGKPFCNAIVWQCTHTNEICQKLIADGGTDRFREITGLPVATYFSGPKITWILDQIPEARKAALEGNAFFGTMDSWIIWQLTGGPDGGLM
jgi:glycerol kinase